MKRTIFTILFVALASVLLPASDLFGQSRTNRISRPCSGSTTAAKVEVESDGDINAVPCVGRSFLVNGLPVAGSLSDGDKGDVTVSGSGSTFTIDANAITTSKIANANVTLAKIANAGANSVLLGSGSSGTGSAYSEISLGTGLSMSGTTLNATAGGVTAGSSLPATCSTGEKYILSNGREFTCLDDDPDTWAEVPLASGSGSAAGQLIRRNSANNGFENWLPTYTASITLESPTSSEDASIFYTDEAITITKLTAVLVGSSPSVTWTVRHSTDRSATGNEVVTSGTTTTSTTTGSVVTSFNDATIPANSFIWLETTAQSGTVANINVTIKYTKD